jgi:hypothetical protein
MGDFDVPEKQWVTWICERGPFKRWQTVQHWIDGVSFPQGYNLAKLAKALDMKPSDLLGQLKDDLEPPPATWVTFLATPEGASTSEEERWSLRLFPWTKEPTVGDYRGLLALLRTNAER